MRVLWRCGILMIVKQNNVLLESFRKLKSHPTLYFTFYDEKLVSGRNLSQSQIFVIPISLILVPKIHKLKTELL